MSTSSGPEPHALTGVVRPPPLRELSALLGFEVVKVLRGTRMRYPSGVSGLHQPKCWWLLRADGARSLAFTSYDLRRADRLNEVALTHWGRSPELGRLTHHDGRRIVRLLHEAIEQEENG